MQPAAAARPIRTAVVGLGFIGRRHVELLSAHPAFALVAACDLRPEAAEALPAGVDFYCDLSELLAELPDLELLHICTPNHLHVPQGLMGLQADCHIVVEKPMGLRSEACLRLQTEAEARQKAAWVVMQNRFTPVAQWLRQLLLAGKLGELLLVQVNCFWNRDARYYQPGSWRGQRATDGGVLYTQFSHFVDTLYWLLGPLEVVGAQMANLNHQGLTEIEDTGMVQLRLPGGGMGSFQFSTATWERNMESSLLLLGSRGSVRIGGQYMNEVSYAHIEDCPPPALPPARPANDYGHYQGSASNHEAVLENVVRVLRGSEAPFATLAEGLAVVRLLEAMYQAAGIALPPPELPTP